MAILNTLLIILIAVSGGALIARNISHTPPQTSEEHMLEEQMLEENTAPPENIPSVSDAKQADTAPTKITESKIQEVHSPKEEQSTAPIVVKEEEEKAESKEASLPQQTSLRIGHNSNVSARATTTRFNTTYAIPPDEILHGGPGKDGIPAITNPKFLSSTQATFLSDDDFGLGIVYKGEARFYPYSILVWHELVNDHVAGDPLLISYCPLCRTGIVFDRRVDNETLTFGVSGMLWQSNLLMYDRVSGSTRVKSILPEESLWSQVLGEAVAGPKVGQRLRIIPANTVTFGAWKKQYPDTTVLSNDTGFSRDYSKDPYGNYYSNTEVGFGATFSDTRLHPKAFVLGIEIENKYKAYHIDALPKNETITDTFNGITLTILRNDADEVLIKTTDGIQVPHIDGFWFSWLAVHPNTELYK